MAHKTTPEENYSGLTEEGFEQWTVGWDELFDFIKQHNGEKIDVTIDDADLEKVKAYFAEDAEECEERAEDFFEEIKKLEIAEETLVLRLPKGLNHLGATYRGYEFELPSSIAKIYLPPTFWAAWSVNKEKFVVPSNYTYKTSWDKQNEFWHYNDEEGEKDNLCKTYETSVTHFPAGKYGAIFGTGCQSTLEQYIFPDCNDDYTIAKVARAMLDNEYDDSFTGASAVEAQLCIVNHTTGETWEMESNDDDEDAELLIDGVMPCYHFVDKDWRGLNYFLVEWDDGGDCYVLGGGADAMAHCGSEDAAEEFPNGFNFGDIKITGYYTKEMRVISFDGIGECYAEKEDVFDGNTIKWCIDGEEYGEDELEDLANGDDEESQKESKAEFKIKDFVLVNYNGAGGDVVIPKGVTEIGANTFRGCAKLDKVAIPEGVVKIGRAAFSFCTNLKSISIPQSVKTIDDMAFRGCENLQSVKIPQSVETIGENAFAGCESLDEETKNRIGEIAE